MVVFHWNSKYETGDVEIDTDHRLMVDTINNLFRSMAEGEAAKVYEGLAAVHTYVTRHFKYEEEIMERVGYPDLEHHRGEHQMFLRRYTSFMDRDPKVLIVRVSVFLHDWLHEHILLQDRRLFAFVRSVQPAVDDPDPEG